MIRKLAMISQVGGVLPTPARTRRGNPVAIQNGQDSFGQTIFTLAEIWLPSPSNPYPSTSALPKGEPGATFVFRSLAEAREAVSRLYLKPTPTQSSQES